MKLKSYLRGLGIGIVMTALIMGIATKDGRPLTDAEIKAAAVKLGMVESSSLRLSDLPQDRTPESPEPDVRGNTESDPSGQDGDEDESEGREDGEESEEEPTPTPTSTPTPTPTPTATPVPNQEESSNAETVKFTISSGTGSRAVCNQLAEAGLIEDAAAFDQYLIDSGYSKRIGAGTYEIPAGASEEEIAKIISRSR